MLVRCLAPLHPPFPVAGLQLRTWPQFSAYVLESSETELMQRFGNEALMTSCWVMIMASLLWYVQSSRNPRSTFMLLGLFRDNTVIPRSKIVFTTGIVSGPTRH